MVTELKEAEANIGLIRSTVAKGDPEEFKDLVAQFQKDFDGNGGNILDYGGLDERVVVNMFDDLGDNIAKYAASMESPLIPQKVSEFSKARDAEIKQEKSSDTITPPSALPRPGERQQEKKASRSM